MSDDQLPQPPAMDDSMLELVQFLLVFFTEGNSINEKQRAFLEPWITRLRRNPRSASFLPRTRMSAAGVEVHQLYVLAFSRRQAHELSLQINGALGATYSSFRGLRSPLTLTDPVEKAVHDFTHGNGFRFRLDSDPERRKDAFRRLRVLIKLLDDRPQNTADEARPLERVLRDFFMALAAGNRVTAEHWLKFLGGHAMLDASNLLFLEVQMLSTLRDDKTLLEHPHLPLLISMRRPPAVTQAVLEAVYRRHLSTVETAEDAVKVYETDIRACYAGLLDIGAGIQSAEARCCLALAAAGEPADWKTVAELASDAPDSEAGRLLKAIADMEPSGGVQTDVVQPTSSVEVVVEGDRDALLRVAKKMEPGIEKVLCMIECYRSSPAMNNRNAVVRAVGELSKEDRDEFKRVARAFLEDLGGDEPSADPGDWNEWLERLNREGPWPDAVRVAKAGSDEWPTKIDCDRLTKLLLADRMADARVVFDRSLPHLVRWLKRDSERPRAEYREVYVAVLACLVSIEKPSPDDLTVIADMMGAVMETGAQRPDELLADVTELFTKVLSPFHMDWALKIVDLLLEHCGNPTVLGSLLHALETCFRSFPAKIDLTQRVIAERLAQQLGDNQWSQRLGTAFTDAEQGQAEANPWENLRGSVLIYTLTTGAGERAKEIICRLAKGAKVTVSNDKVLTPHLKDAATHATYVVLTARSASHAATVGLASACGGTDRFVYATGKGCASIVTALRNKMCGVC